MIRVAKLSSKDCLIVVQKKLELDKAFLHAIHYLSIYLMIIKFSDNSLTTSLSSPTKIFNFLEKVLRTF